MSEKKLNGKKSPEKKKADAKQREVDFTRRAMLHAGWTVPVVTSLKIPGAFAASPPPHNDTPHEDTRHLDDHADTHKDTRHLDHDDTTHEDHEDHEDHMDEQHCDGWNKESFTLPEIDCDEMTATIKNGDDSGTGTCPVKWELWYAESGNPKDGSKVYEGEIDDLPWYPGETRTIDWSAGYGDAGNYMVLFLQNPAHPGNQEIWTAQCSY